MREEGHDALVELTGGDGVKDDDADRVARARRNRHRDDRLKAFLLELGDVVHPRILECVLADEGGLPVTRDPPGEALVEPELDLPDDVGVHVRGRAQSQPLSLQEVDEARVTARRLGQQLNRRGEEAVEVRRGGDNPDDAVERVALQTHALELGELGACLARRAAGTRHSVRFPP